MKIKVDSCISTGKEFYGTIYPESKKEMEYLQEMIEIADSEEMVLHGFVEEQQEVSNGN